MKTKLLRQLTLPLLLTCMAFIAVPAMADSLSDVLIVRNPAGQIVQSITAMESQEGNGDQIFFIGVPALADPTQFGHATTLCEEGTITCDANTPFTSLSDIVGVIQVTIGRNTQYYLGFTSDGENGIAPGTETAFGGLGDHFIIEQANTNQVIDVTYLLNPDLRNHGWTATFQSVFVPEPGTLVLLGTGFIGIASLARRRMSKNI